MSKQRCSAAAVLITLGLAYGCGGGSGSPSKRSERPTTASIERAAGAAGCNLVHPKVLGSRHIDRRFKPSEYNTNPPTSGPHPPRYYNDEILRQGLVPELGKSVHTLEHGLVEIQYAKGSPRAIVRPIEALFAEKAAEGHMFMFENATHMPYAVAATAWGQLLGCEAMNAKVVPALRAFYERYVDQAPDSIP